MEMNNIEQVWQNYYHFSSMREGLLSWYEFKDNASILEWSPEKGALTEWLSEHCKDLTCVAKNDKQRQLLHARLHGKSNVQIVSEEETDCGKGGAYDYVIAVNPFASSVTEAEMVQKYHLWKKMLNPGGKLLLVMNNRLSVNRQIGIKNVWGKEVDKTTLKNDLEKLFSCVHFYYIFPDFIFPQMIYSDKHLPGYEVVERIIPYARNIDRIEEDGCEIYRSVAKNGMLCHMANSLFVECGNDGNSCEIIGATITAERGNYALATRIRENGSVEKIALNEKAVSHIEKIGRNMQALKVHKISVVPFKIEKSVLSMPFIDAPVMTDWFKQVIQRNVDEFLKLFESFYQKILCSSQHAKPQENALLQKYGVHEWGPILKDTYLEMTPLNCFFMEDGFCFFDQEYVAHYYPAKYVLFRSLAHLYYLDDVFERYVPLECMKEKYGLTDLWDIFAQEEEIFLKNVRGEEQNVDFYSTLTLNNKYKYDDFRDKWDINKICYLICGGEDKKIVVWGTGNIFREFMNQYGKWIRIDFAVDSDEQLWGTRKQGILIKNPETLSGENVHVIIACSASEEIVKRLEELNVRDFRIFPFKGGEDEY